MNKEEREKCEFEVDLKTSFLVAVLLYVIMTLFLKGQILKRVWILAATSEKGCEKCHLLV